MDATTNTALAQEPHDRAVLGAVEMAHLVAELEHTVILRDAAEEVKGL